MVTNKLSNQYSTVYSSNEQELLDKLLVELCAKTVTNYASAEMVAKNSYPTAYTVRKDIILPAKFYDTQ